MSIIWIKTRTRASLEPLLLAKLERLAAARYRTCANDHPDRSVKEGLLACAVREKEIAKALVDLHRFLVPTLVQNKMGYLPLVVFYKGDLGFDDFQKEFCF